jgi:hypothetical protein
MLGSSTGRRVFAEDDVRSHPIKIISSRTYWVGGRKEIDELSDRERDAHGDRRGDEK